MNGALQVGPQIPSQYADISSLQWYGSYGWEPGTEPQDELSDMDGFLEYFHLEVEHFKRVNWEVSSALCCSVYPS